MPKHVHQGEIAGTRRAPDRRRLRDASPSRPDGRILYPFRRVVPVGVV
ncbi:MAG: hypothetical protein QN183_11210 [Armatimonadota bacterium]|nr:hypothetical protein [Armatimonadota bacterium]MDR7533172.1 hypothetical protein [Armatimonadota bacterium]MDR7536920.1 hypothetical protein [Armatimonadota bacterium]